MHLGDYETGSLRDEYQFSGTFLWTIGYGAYRCIKTWYKATYQLFIWFETAVKLSCCAGQKLLGRKSNRSAK